MRNNNSKADRTAFNKGGGKGKKTRQPKINKSFPKRGKVNTEVTRDGELDASGRTLNFMHNNIPIGNVVNIFIKSYVIKF